MDENVDGIRVDRWMHLLGGWILSRDEGTLCGLVCINGYFLINSMWLRYPYRQTDRVAEWICSPKSSSERVDTIVNDCN